MVSTRVREEDSRMFALDAFRGVACAVVLVYHYMHFVYVGEAGSAAFAPALHDLYLHGWLGVDSFFCLSGFIFGKLFGDRIASREISAKAFFIGRLSRLYPMFVVTSIVCAVLLFVFANRTGTTFLHQDHDTALAFVAELFLVRQWGSEWFAFNRSAWSISIEVLMYLVFFVSRRTLPNKGLLVAVALVVLAFLVRYHVGQPLVRGLFGFFLGVAAFEAMRMPNRRSWKHRGWLEGLALSSALAIAVVGCWHVMDRNVEEGNYSTIFLADLGFIAIIVLASKVRITDARLARFCAYLGELSYPAYLVHFPLQIAIVLGVRSLGLSAPADRAWFWIAYMALVVATAAAAHRFFEVPAREWIRRTMRVRERPTA